MANVKFKRGSQASLNTLIAGGVFEDGCFYLTDDTDRLYVAQGANELVELNKSITVVSSVSELPTEDVYIGQFYYVSGTNLHNGEQSGNGNILAVCTSVDAQGKNPHWTQVNPDTNDNDNDHLGSVSVVKGTESNGVIPYTLTFQMVDKNGANKSGTQPSVTLNIDAADIIKTMDASVSSAVSGNVATVTTKLKDLRNNTFTTGSAFSVKGGDNVSLSKDADGNIVISTGVGSDSVKMAVEGASNLVTASVQVNGADSGTALKLAGEKGIAVSYSDSTAKFGHTNEVSDGTSGGATEAATTLTNGGSFTAVIESKYDAYGHVTSQKKQTITLPTIAASTIDVDSSDASKLTFAVKDSGTGVETAAATSGSVLFPKITVDGVESTVKNQESLGSFYSKDSIDSMMRNLDALTYKGVVASTADIPTSGVAVGDTYKVSANDSVVVNGKTASLGDLIIATGTEGADGTIGSDLAWTLVAGGSDTDTTYKTKVVAGAANVANVGIISSTSNGSFTQYVPFSGDGVVTVTATEGEDNNGKVAIAHANSGVTANTYGTNAGGEASAGGSIKVPSFTVDAKGHITSASEATITLPGNVKVAASAADKKVSVQTSAGVDLGSVTFANGNMTTSVVTADGVNETVTFNHNTVAKTNDTTATASKNLTSATDSDRQIAAITGITRDDYGHITAVQTSTITLGRVSDKLSSSITSGTNSVTVRSELQDYNGSNDGKGAVDFTLKSPNETISVTNTTNTNDINIDIVWGSF